MTPIVTLTLVDGTRVVVPDSLDLITPYVLREQQDWFEEEIRFLRRLIEPGQKAIDIGANYGVYTVSIARVVGPAGHVWAFEPASATANLLAQSIRANGFSQVTIEQRALSSEGGTAQLSLEVNAELNALQRDSQAAGASEPVSLTTLDDRLQAYGWQEIDFLKIDAEGEEARILAGGAQFFARLSPLVQFETSSGTSQNLSLVDDFAARGYDAYRLVPALDALVPYDRNSRPEEAPLNLFCCKPERARRLAARGVLIEAATLESGRDRLVDAVRRRIRSEAALGWRRNLASLPYGAMLADAWERRMQGGRGAKAEEALALYALSRDIDSSIAERYCALVISFTLLSALCDARESPLRLASLARVARDLGARPVAVRALSELSDILTGKADVDPNEPFLLPEERFETMDPGTSPGDWLLSSVLEALERTASFSSYYLGLAARQRLEMIEQLGRGSPEMQRRLALLRQRFQLPPA